MKIAEVIGTVTLNRCHPSFDGATLKITLPLSLENLTEGSAPDTADTRVCWDELGAGIGSKIAVSDGAEAAQPFRPQLKPVDAYVSALLDHIDIVTNDE